MVLRQSRIESSHHYWRLFLVERLLRLQRCVMSCSLHHPHLAPPYHCSLRGYWNHDRIQIPLRLLPLPFLSILFTPFFLLSFLLSIFSLQHQVTHLLILLGRHYTYCALLMTLRIRLHVRLVYLLHRLCLQIHVPYMDHASCLCSTSWIRIFASLLPKVVRRVYRQIRCHIHRWQKQSWLSYRAATAYKRTHLYSFPFRL